MHIATLNEVLEPMQKKFEAENALLSEEMTFEDILFLYEMGYQLYLTGAYEKGEVVFQRLVLAKPQEPKFWQGLASCMQMQNKFEEALIPWSMYCLIDRTSPIPHYHAAECLFSLGQIEEGLKALNAAKERDETKEFSGKIALLEEVWREN